MVGSPSKNNTCAQFLREHVQYDAQFAFLHNDELPATVQSTMLSRLSDAEGDLSTLENEIARMESILHALRSQRAQDLSRIEFYREALAPHRKLPNEVLGEIFVYATRIVTLPPKEYWREAPWNISHVCAKWRNIALSTPALWDYISVVHDVPNTIYHGSNLSPVRNTLVHSGHSLIVFNIRVPSPTFLGYRGGQYRADPISTVIIPHKDQPRNMASVAFSLYLDHIHQRSQDSTAVSAITRAGSLTTLRINIPVPASDVDAIIRQTPSLSALHLPNGNPFAISTLANISHGRLLPKLDKLSCMLTTEIRDAFFDMLENRRILPCTDISTVNFYILPGGLDRDLEREGSLQNQGWEIAVYTCT